MTKLYADRSMPNTNGWQDRHDAAVTAGGGSAISRTGERAFETPVVQMLTAWKEYAMAHKARYESLIGDDGVLGQEWEAIGDGLRGLLNGQTGRLDCGTLDGFILETMKEHGVDTEQK